MADCTDHQQQGILDVGNLVNEQENNKLKGTKEKNGRVRNKSDKKNSNNAEGMLVTDSDTKLREIYGESTETKQEKSEQLVRQQSQITPKTTKSSKQEEQESGELGLASGNEESGQSKVTIEEGKDTCIATEPGNTSQNKSNQLDKQKIQITADTAESSEQEKYGPVELEQAAESKEGGQNEVTIEEGKDTCIATEPANTSQNKSNQLDKQQSQTTPGTAESSEKEEHRPVELGQATGNEESGQNEVTFEERKDTCIVTEPGNTSRRKRKDLLTVKEIVEQPDKPWSPLPQSPLKPTMIYFYLFIPGNDGVENAKIRFWPETSKPICLRQLEETKNLWYCKVTFNSDPVKFRLTYKYSVDTKSAYYLIYETPEHKKRNLKRQVLFDIFQFPDNRHTDGETIPKAVVWYLEWLMQLVTNATIPSILTYIESLIPLLSTNYELSSWILKKSSHNPITDIQQFYLCMILMRNERSDSTLSSPPNENKTVCDRFLHCFSTCAQYNILSVSDHCIYLNRLEKFAIILMKNSSSPGWLTLSACFYPYLGVKFLLDNEAYAIPDYKYTDEKYQELVTALFSGVNIFASRESSAFKNQAGEHKKLLHLVLKSAPTWLIALNIFKHREFPKLFPRKNEKVNFFVSYYQEVQEAQKRSEDKSLPEKLAEFDKIPVDILGRIYKMLHPALLEYTKLDDVVDKEVVVRLLIATINDLGVNEFTEILRELSTSMSGSRQEVLLAILSEAAFKDSWHKIPFDTKVDICKSWIISRVSSMDRGSSDSEHVEQVYTSMNAIMKCHCNNSIDKDLVPKVFTHISKECLEDRHATGVLAAFDKLTSPVNSVRNCYISHVRRILSQELIKNSTEILEKWTDSSLGRELLSCVLEIIDETNDSNDADKNTNENCIMKILDWCDIWRIFHKTATLRDKKKCQAGIKICEDLSRHIENGNITVNLLKVLDEKKEEVSKLCVAVRPGSNPKEQISKLINVRDNCSKKIELLGSVINHCTRLSAISIPGIETIIKTLNDLKETCPSKRVRELQDSDAFWGTLQELLGPAEALEPLVNSLSFRAGAKNGWNKKLSSSSAGESDGEATEVNFVSLLMFLTTKAKETFEEQWGPVLDDPDSVIMDTMDTLLDSIKDEKTLDEELNLVGNYFKKEFSSDAKRYLKDYVKYPNVLRQVQHLCDILMTFELANRFEETFSVLLHFQATLKSRKTLTFGKLHEQMETLEKTIPCFSGEDCVIRELSRSRELVSFIEEIIDEDIRFLIDAVDEHSDQLVAESSVSDLIEVHSFLAPLIKMKTEAEKFNAQDFLKTLNTACRERGDIAVKIQQCNTYFYSLRGLYKSIADRGETTKDIIRNCLRKGKYLVRKVDGKITTTMTYVPQESGKSEREYSLSDLHDLRSRALLIVTSEKDTQEYENSETFGNFMKQIDLVTEISDLVSKLQLSGYDKYRQKGFWREMKSTDSLQDVRNNLQDDLEQWRSELESAREKFHFLNYYRSDQLCTLNDFLTNAPNINNDKVLSLIHFVNKTINIQHLEKFRDSQKIRKKSDRKDKDHLKMLLTTVGKGLEMIFHNSQCQIRKIHNDDGERPIKLEATVAGGEIFVASLEPKSQLTAKVILELYEYTSNALPEPYQIVFCSSKTMWEELHLLLQRCFAHSQKHKRFYHKRLFCVANVELLQSELQFRLVEAITQKQNLYQSRSRREDTGVNSDYQLALICCGGAHHHIVEQFSQYSHHIANTSDLAFANRFESSWPAVKIVTSTLPGLGKTETIKREVLGKNMNIKGILIVGPFEPIKFIKRLQDLVVTKNHCLHLDIGEVSDPGLLDTFLFQLIVTGMVSAGNQLYRLQTAHIYIEIANTLKDWLQESLGVLKIFTRTSLQWQNYEDLVVSTEITSNIQIVCQYLDLFDKECIQSQEVYFRGPKRCKPQPAERCRELLAKYFPSNDGITFTTLHIFLKHLASQLLKFSNSTFFKIESLNKYLLVYKGTSVRKDLFETLLEVSKQFASPAMTTCCSRDTRNISQKEFASASDKTMVSTMKSAKNMVERVEGIIRWTDSNHLVVVFQGLNSHAITAMYREKRLVPENIKKLLASQRLSRDQELEDLNTLTQGQLQGKLEKIACTKLVEKRNLFPSYALTSDNILKMTLIILRVRANIPVIIMGETGCGKTSLVRYLANTCGVQTFCSFNVHAGISEEDIINFIKLKENHARDTKEKVWIFLDEINTCDHLGLLSDVMCHHSLLGRPLSKNLVFIAACNPYTLRPEKQIKTAGLEGRNITDEYSKLVYRVHPLPEAMIHYVWDYGSLSPKDERDYVKRMVKHLPEQFEKMLIDLLTASQKFIRDTEENAFCVSLRDVHRCIQLISWFEKMIKKRQDIQPEYQRMSEQCNREPMIKSIVLALAHCYLSRLPTAELRKDYRQKMMDLFCRNSKIMKFNINEDLDVFLAIVRMEQKDYLGRMELPPGTARNAALRENVFVMLVCILNKIPIFVVGKPGCSKSLSIQLIRSNLRGRDSRDPLFKELPQLYVVSYQGSESSTSEGIIKVFEKARKYKAHNKDVLPVVLLDEVGLAENSKYNPLKVLHGLLEPGEGKELDVAVVGISNWSLDAAKMNRAIHLSRPEPTKDDLYETGHSLHYADGENNSPHLGPKELRCLAEAYFEYQDKQTHANFHGLRDYYFLIKSLTGCNDMFKQVNLALQRNFGGLPDELSNIQTTFLNKLRKNIALSDKDIVPVSKLIQANLKDPHARHLMLITSGNSAVDILNENLAKLKKKTVKIYGSHFEEDQSEEYSHKILSSIILCMERDCILILRDLERIYGSLYDMLNQNYAVVGNRKNCRVALGPYSNPMCQVNDGFRCIVLIDHLKVDYSDPPFLNRFEKQVLRFSDVLTDDQRNIIAKLLRWVQGMSTVEGLQSHFDETDMFIGFHEDTLPSLVLSQTQDTNISPEELLKKCKNELMWIASPDAVIRTQKCIHLKEDRQDVLKSSDEYFEKPLHQGIAGFMTHVINNHHKSSFFAGDEIGSKTVVMTFSNIHTDISQCLGSGFKCQVERLSAYKSEKQLAERINEFWQTPEKKLLILQCKPDLDGTHLLLARSIIEGKRNSYKQCLLDTKESKHVCIVLHVQRGETTNSVPWQFTFLCGWRQVFLDMLETPPVSLTEIRGKSMKTLLTSAHIWSIERIAKDHLLWCFSCIKYTRNQRPLDKVLHIVQRLFSSKEVSKVIETLILDALEHDQKTYFDKLWQIEVACDRQLLVNSLTLYCAMERFVSRLVRNALAKIVYFLENENSWPPHLENENTGQPHPAEVSDKMSKLENLWCKFIMDADTFKISEIGEPRCTECYVLEGMILNLCLPFSQRVIKKIDVSKELFLHHYTTLAKNEDNLDEKHQLKETVRQQLLENFTRSVFRKVSRYSSDCSKLYMKDVLDMATSDLSQLLNRDDRISIAKAVFFSRIKQYLPTKDSPEFYTLLHTFVWLHSEQIIDILKMFRCCRPFIDKDVLRSVTNAHGLEDVTLVKSDEAKLSQEDKVVEKRYQDSKGFADNLVTSYCEKMLPSQEIVEKNGGLEGWMRNANLLLSSAVTIGKNSPAFYYLQMCVDFARVMSISVAPPTDLVWLFRLREIGEKFRPKYMDHQESFQAIVGEIIKQLDKKLEKDMVKRRALQKFSALFYGRCIDTNIGTSAIRLIIEQILSLKRPELVISMSPVVLQLLEVREMQSFEKLEDLITSESATKDYPCLQNIDQQLKSLSHHDLYPAVMICDLIERLLNFEDRYKIDDINGSDSKVLVLAKDAAKLISQNSEDVCGLRLLSAVAFLRGFFTMFAKFVAETCSTTIKKDPRVQEMKNVISLLNDQKLYLQTFFLKQFHEHDSLFDLKKRLEENNVLPTIQELLSEGKFQDKAVFTSVFRYPEYEEAKAAYCKKLETNDDLSMQEFLTKCKNSPDCAFVLLGLLINMVCLKRTVRKLDNEEEELVDWFVEKVSSFSFLFQELLLGIIGRRNFHCPQLQLSIESSVEEVEMALLVLHIACVVATGKQSKNLPMHRYLTNPSKCKQPCVLAHDKEDIRSVFIHQSPIKDSACVTCTCGSRWAFKNNANERKCPHCQKVLIDGTTRSTSPETATTLSMSFDGDEDLCTKDMSPAAYRALNLIVYSSFYTGIALGISSKKELSDVLHLLREYDFDSDSTSPGDFCFENIENNLTCLTDIFLCNKNVAINTMHLVVEKSSDLIRGLRESNDCSTKTLRQKWENEFSQLTETVFLTGRETSKEAKEMIKLQQTGVSDEITLECRILELDNYAEKPGDQNQQLKRLLRVTKQPCLEDIRSEFLNSPKDVKEKHSFLMLLFAKFDQLPTIGNLYPLIKWSRQVSSALNLLIRKDDVQNKSINDFLEEHNQSQKETLKNVFTKFKEAWEKVRPLVNRRLMDKIMPTIEENTCVAYCLTGNECGIYLQTAIEILVYYQNSFLDAVTSLSSDRKHPHALSFLQKGNVSGVLSASLQEVKEKEIISFQWSNDLLKYAQNNLEYGKGREVIYDFERIEMELAKEIVFGKCYLTGTLNKFMFANDLFHSSGPLLTEIRSLVKQSPSLPPKLLTGLSLFKQERFKDALDLLPHIAVLMYLLKRQVEISSVDKSLEDFVKECKLDFPENLLPEPRSSITIAHITALYEALEDVLADGAIEGLDRKFREELPDDMKETVKIMGKIDQFKPHNLLKALRRFVFRCLSSETKGYWPEQDKALKYCLNEPSLWFPLDQPNVEDISQDITLKYLFSMITYLKEISHKKMKGSYSKRLSSQPTTRPPEGLPLLQGTVHTNS